MLKQAVIFVVDDEPLVRKALKQSIESLDARVVCFPSALACLEAVEQDDVCDLVITDMNMPEMNGLELLERLRKCLPLVPVLLVTGYGSVPIAVKSMHLGAADFIEKPLDEDVLLPKLEALLKNLQSDQDSEKLSRAEERVLQLVAEGRSNKEIAYLLNRSIRTVENHRHRLMKKLKVTSTAEMVRVALSYKFDSANKA